MALAPYNTSYPDEPGTAGALAKELDEPESVTSAFARQHPLHGAIARVYEKLGGEDFMEEWAEENPGDFMRMLFKLAPAAIPKGQTGGIHLHVHNALQPSPLDAAQGVTIDQEPDE